MCWLLTSVIVAVEKHLCGLSQHLHTYHIMQFLVLARSSFTGKTPLVMMTKSIEL